MLVTIIVCIMILCYEFGSEENFKKDIFYEIITGIAFTTITIFIISIFNWIIGNKDIQKAQRDDTLLRMMDLLVGNTPNNKNIINELYSPEAAKCILKNALSRLNRRLAQGYSLIAACEEDVIRENFEYNINMFQNGNGAFRMAQNLKYKRYFKLPDNASSECYLQCGFAFSTDGLNKLLEQNIYFLREEIADPTLVAVLRDATIANNINMVIDKLQFRVVINEHEQRVPIKDIILEPIIDNNAIVGILLRTKVDYTDEEDGMRSYTGRVTFVIPAPENRRFYCVFVDPVIGTTKFSFHIDPKMITNIRDVDYVEILTRAGSGKEHVERVDDYTMEFGTNDTILPKSAIIAFW